MAIPETYLAAAEPSWAKRISGWQLLGLLNLSAILSPRVFLSDVQLGDNLHIFHSYLRNSRAGLFTQICEFARQGVVSPLLRDRTVRPQQDDDAFEVDSFGDVFLSWLQLDSPAAWINPDISADRRRYFEALDAQLKNSAIVRYSYAAVKKRFMHDVREAAASSEAEWFQRAIAPFTSEQRASYDQILSRDWFSLSDMYAFLQESGVSVVGLSSLLAHGLINEAAYSREVDASFTGFDTVDQSVEQEVWGEDRPALWEGSPPSRNELLERASTVLETPALSVLAALTPDEVCEIRAFGRRYFEFAEHFARLNANSDEIERAFTYEATQYWGTICDYVRDQHPSVTMRPRKVALYLSELPWPMSELGEETFRFAVSVAQEAAIGEGDKTTKKLVARSAQYIFLEERDELFALRRVLPRNAWSKPALPSIPRSGE